jgi:tetratricopeptide (TPR) repeat protein
MAEVPSGDAVRAVAAPAALWAVAALLAAAADARMPQGSTSFSLNDSLYRLLGTAKEAVGDVLFLKADSYYHGGSELEYEHEDYQKEGLIDDGGRAEAPSDWIARVYDRVRSHAHYHLKDQEKKEMLPFFALATTLDPKNVEAVLTTAYWLEAHFGKSDEALEVLRKGSRDNPDAWQIDLRLGLLASRRKEDPALALRHLEEALRKSRGKEVERYEALDMHYYAAEACLKLGRPKEALGYYLGALAFTEEGTEIRSVIRRKALELQRANLRETGQTVLI